MQPKSELTVHTRPELIVPASRFIFEPMVQNPEEKARRAFAGRLNKALDKMTDGPPSHGRAVWLAEKMDVSPKGAGKWLNGEAMPETAKLPKLADVAKCSGAWLLFGDPAQAPKVSEPEQVYGARDYPQAYRVYEQLAKLEREKKITAHLITAMESMIKAAAPATAMPATSNTNYTVTGYTEPVDLGLDDDAQLGDLTDYLQKAVEALQNFRARKQPAEPLPLKEATTK